MSTEAAISERETPLADRMFNAYLKHQALESQVEDAINNGMNESFSWGYLTYDYYDGSMEFKDAEDGATLTPELQAVIWRLGFRQLWLCHKGGSEIYYHPNLPQGHFKASR